MMRALVAANVLSRREETVLFVPVNAATDPDVETIVADAVGRSLSVSHPHEGSVARASV